MSRRRVLTGAVIAARDEIDGELRRAKSAEALAPEQPIDDLAQRGLVPLMTTGRTNRGRDT